MTNNDLPHGAPPPPAPVPAQPVAAIPSRAAPETPVNTVQATPPVREPFKAPVAGKVRRKRGPNKKPREKKLSAAEIRSLNAKREKALKAKKKRKPNRTDAMLGALARHALPEPVAPKSANRPKEMKTQLQAVLAATKTLQKPELNVFATTMESMAGLSRAGRKRVIAELSRVYP